MSSNHCEQAILVSQTAYTTVDVIVFDLLLICATGVTTFAVCLESIATVNVRSLLATRETDLFQLPAANDNNQAITRGLSLSSVPNLG